MPYKDASLGGGNQGQPPRVRPRAVGRRMRGGILLPWQRHERYEDEILAVLYLVLFVFLSDTTEVEETDAIQTIVLKPAMMWN